MKKHILIFAFLALILSAGKVWAVTSTTIQPFQDLTEKVTPVDADLLIIADSADNNNYKKVQKSNLGGGASAVITFGIASVPVNDARYLPLGDRSVTGSTVETQTGFVAPRDGTISNLYIDCVSNTFNVTSTYTVRENEVDTALTAGLLTSNLTANDTSNSFSTTAGDTITVEVNTGLGSGSATYCSVSFEFGS